MQLNTLLLQASARPHGNTHQVAKQLAATENADLLDLLDYKIYPFNYDQEYPEDDNFLQLITEEVLPRDSIIFATPGYWYTMSGALKDFFDRLSDLLKSRKDLGRQLRGKRMAVMACSNDEEINDSFFSAFQLSAKYLGMEYGPEWQGWLVDGEVQVQRYNS